MGNPDGVCAVCRLWFAAHKRQSLLITGERIDSPAYFPMHSGLGLFSELQKPFKQVKMNMQYSQVTPQNLFMSMKNLANKARHSPAE